MTKLFLDRSPLNSTDLFSKSLKESSSLPIIESKPKEFVPPINIKPTKILPEPEKNFPLSVGRAILSDTLSQSWLFNLHPQEEVNKNIRKAVKDPCMSIKSLINYGASICDLFSAKIILDIEDLKEHKFIPSDLIINKTLFNISHLGLLFNIKYKDLLKKKISFDLYYIKKCQFNHAELYAFGFNFPMCFDEIKKIIKIAQSHKKSSKDIINGTKEYLKALNATYEELVSLGLTKEHLQFLDLSEESLIKALKINKK